MNTRFSYMYRDSANWKTFYDCVVAGEFSDTQKEAIQNACDAYLDVLAENTQYLSDINTDHFFRTVFELLNIKYEGRFLGTDIHAVCRGINTQQQGIGNEKPSVQDRIAFAASRAGRSNPSDASRKQEAREKNNEGLHEK